jgi:hypothetical protein
LAGVYPVLIASVAPPRFTVPLTTS